MVSWGQQDSVVHNKRGPHLHHNRAAASGASLHNHRNQQQFVPRAAAAQQLVVQRAAHLPLCLRHISAPHQRRCALCPDDGACCHCTSSHTILYLYVQSMVVACYLHRSPQHLQRTPHVTWESAAAVLCRVVFVVSYVPCCMPE